MDAAGSRIEHAADKSLRTGFLPHLMGIEDADIRVAHLAFHPIGFVDGGSKRRVVMRRLDLSVPCQVRAGNAELGNQLLDDLYRFMRDLVHAPGHRTAVGRVDAAEGLPELCGDDAAIAAACPPTWTIGLQYNRHQPTFGDVMRGGEPGVARADDDNVGLNIARQRWKGTRGPGRARPERSGRCHWGPDLCHRAPYPVQCPTAASAKAFMVGK